MSRYQIRIELLSDLCVSDGGVYNSALDTELCYDSYGFPFIPAKRLKGCLRECALELREWGKEIPLEMMFGEGGRYEKAGKIFIGNAYLEDYESMKAEAKEHSGSVLFHPQNVLNYFSYIRTQTSIDYDTGAADEGTLRTMRVAKKGLTFIAEAEIREPEDDLRSALKSCCRILQHMGIARTRGLGEIKVTLEEGQESIPIQHAPWKEGADCIRYAIHLEEPVICKSVNGGEAKTLDYIEGSKMLGIIAEILKNRGEDFREFMAQGKLVCSNAYIGNGKKRFAEVPAYLYAIKNNGREYVNKLYEEPKEPENIQLNMMKHCYVWADEDQNLETQDVRVEERYHHRRPSDKAVGRASEESDAESHFYQMSSIMAGQTFLGYIRGAAAQIRRVYEGLTERNDWRLGYSRSAEYGKVQIQVLETTFWKEPEEGKYREFVVKLEAPAILYNEKAFCSVDINDLKAEVGAVLGVSEEDCEDVQSYLNYTTVGGYNVTWGKRKPILSAFDKGTALQYRMKTPVSLSLPSVYFIGERTSEGFGEISVYPIDRQQRLRHGRIAKEEERTAEPELDVKMGTFGAKLCGSLFLEYVKTEAVEQAKAFAAKAFAEGKDIAGMRPVVGNMMLMCAQAETLEQVKENAVSRYGKKSAKKENKYQIADMILDCVKEDCSRKITDGFEQRYNIRCKDGYPTYERLYLKEFLNELKYLIRMKEKKGAGKDE